MTFDIGDRVVVKNQASLWCGQVGTVKERDSGPLTDETRYYVFVDGHNVYCYYESDLEISVLDELAKVVS